MSITRRTALMGIAAAPAVALGSTMGAAPAAFAVPAAHTPPETFARHPLEVSQALLDVIYKHQDAKAWFTKLCTLGYSDQIALGREPTEAEERMVDEASDAECRALMAVCRYRPSNQGEHRFKAAYLLDQHKDGSLEPEEVEALLYASTGMVTVEREA